MLRTHYRSPLNFDNKNLGDAKQGLARLYTAIKNSSFESKSYQIDWTNQYALRFKMAMNDDFNTPLAISVLFEIALDTNKNENIGLTKLLIALANTIGLLNRASDAFMQGETTLAIEEIQKLITARMEAKKNKIFALADQIRDELLTSGIILEDSPTGTTWRKA